MHVNYFSEAGIYRNIGRIRRGPGPTARGPLRLFLIIKMSVQFGSCFFRECDKIKTSFQLHVSFFVV